MIYINEWLPNPTGPDNCVNCGKGGEFIELYNGGAQVVGLGGWMIKTESGKKFSLSGHRIAPHGYTLLKRSETKLSLRNTDGGLTLYGAEGRLIDRAQFLGSAPEGKSFSRVDHGTAETTHFAFVGPTPGAPNETVSTAIRAKEYPLNVPLNAPLSPMVFGAIVAGTAALLVGLIMYVIHSHEDVAKLLFGGDDGVW